MAEGSERVTVRFFGALHALRSKAGLPTATMVDVPVEGILARDLARGLDLPLDAIEGVFCNGDVFGLSRVLRPGDRVAFVPYGTPGPHRYYLGLYTAGLEDDGEASSPRREEPFMDMAPRSISQCEEALARARCETRDAFANRALMYWYIYDELAAEVGADRATTIMKQAVFRRGLEVGRKYRAAAESRDLAAVGAIFCDGSPSEGELFSPGIEALDDDRLVLRMESCPLVDAWRTFGLAPEEIDRMCEISAAVDQGTFQGAGLSLEFLDRLGKPGSCRCLLELKAPVAEE